MAVVGFNFNKIDAQRKGNMKGKINITNNVSIKSVEETDLNVGKNKQSALKFEFEFISKYEPDFGKILLGGELVYLEDDKKIKSILEEWKKNKKVEPDVMGNVLNNILSRANVQALVLSRDINLPPPIPLPKVQPEAVKGSQYIG